MVKTYNRTPQQVNTPSTNPTSYFIQTDWKGINENKNYLTVDQNSFEDCNNVYINKDGLLQTRPSLSTVPNDITEKITDVKVFNDIIVYICGNILYFYRDTNLLHKFVATNNQNTFLNEDGKIFVFSWDRLSYFDTTKDAFVNDASDKIYVPEYLSAGDNVTNEPKNLLTNAKKYKHLLTRDDNVPPEFINKRVDIVVDANNNTVTYDRFDNESVIFGKYDTKVYGYSSIRNWQISDNDRIAFYNYGTITYLYYDTVNNTEFSERIDVSNNYTLSAISNDGRLLLFTTGYGVEKSIYYLDLTQSISSENITNLIVPKDVNEEIFAVNSVDADNISVLTRDVSTGHKYWYVGGMTGMSKVPGIYSYNFSSADVHKSRLYLQGSVRKHVIIGYDNIVRKNYIHISPDVFQHVDGTILDFCENVNEECVYVAIYNSYNLFINKYNYNGEVTAVGVIATDSYNVLLERDGNGNATGNVYVGTTKYSIGDSGSYYEDSIVKVSTSSPYAVPVFVSKSSLYYYNPTGESIDEDGYAMYYDLYSSTRWSVAELSYSEGLSYKYPFDTDSKFAKLDRWYVNKSNDVFVSKPKYSDAGNFLWYFPENSYNKFNSNVTNLHVISRTEVGIFLENELWYSSYDAENDLNHFVKSKIQGGCKKGSDVITTFDGKYVVFSTQRGLAYLTYQDFVATTEQSLTFLSDAIQNTYDKFASNPVKLCKYKHWIYCYNESNIGLLLDLRSSSWWKFTFPVSFDNVLIYNEKLLGLSKNKLFTINETSTIDDCENGKLVDWKIVSQKLHFGAINNYKHVDDIFINFVTDESITNTIKLSFEIFDNLQITSKSAIVEYDVDIVKSFIKKLNFFKVYALQYSLQSDDENVLPDKVSITNLSIKYGIKGQVK